MKLKKFQDFSFALQTEFEFVNFCPEAIAQAIEELGIQYAIANSNYEKAKDQAEYIFKQLTADYKGDRGSVSGAEVLAGADPKYQQALSDRREAERFKIEAQSSFRAAENYSRMILTKVSVEGKVAEYYKKGGLT
jgi:hypothetical protein